MSRKAKNLVLCGLLSLGINAIAVVGWAMFGIVDEDGFTHILQGESFLAGVLATINFGFVTYILHSMTHSKADEQG